MDAAKTNGHANHLRPASSRQQHQVPSQIWVISLPTGLVFCQFLMVFLPKASEFVLASFRVYEAVVIYKYF